MHPTAAGAARPSSPADDDRVPAAARCGRGPAGTADRTAIARQDGRRGIRDQLGGGFHRYATDAVWLVPHFEQMLYDNAQLARTYLHAWALTGERRYREVATGVLDYVLRELTTSDGAFAASQDADTEGEEGLTFTWRADEVRAALGEDAALFATAYGVTDGGNWEGVSILSRVRPTADLAKLYGIPGSGVEATLARAREKLLAIRATRPQPARDDKALASWNGLAIAALADAARLLGFQGDGAADAARYREAAERAATTVLEGLLGEDGRLGRSWKDGRATGQGVLEDHADPPMACSRCTRRRSTSAGSPPAGGSAMRSWSDRRSRRRVLRHRDRPRETRHAAKGRPGQRHPVGERGGDAGPSAARRAFTGESRYREAADRALTTITPYTSRYPTAFAMWLQAIDLALAPVAEVAIVGDRDEATQALLQVASGGYSPNRVVALRDQQTLRHPAPRGPDAGQGTVSCLRLPRLRVPAPGHRCRGAP